MLYATCAIWARGRCEPRIDRLHHRLHSLWRFMQAIGGKTRGGRGLGRVRWSGCGEPTARCTPPPAAGRLGQSVRDTRHVAQPAADASQASGRAQNEIAARAHPRATGAEAARAPSRHAPRARCTHSPTQPAGLATRRGPGCPGRTAPVSCAQRRNMSRLSPRARASTPPPTPIQPLPPPPPPPGCASTSTSLKSHAETNA